MRESVVVDVAANFRAGLTFAKYEQQTDTNNNSQISLKVTPKALTHRWSLMGRQDWLAAVLVQSERSVDLEQPPVKRWPWRRVAEGKQPR